jgi:hypothetical protein
MQRCTIRAGRSTGYALSAVSSARLSHSFQVAIIAWFLHTAGKAGEKPIVKPKPRPAKCPQCASLKTVQVAERFGELSFFCSACEHSWTVRSRELVAALRAEPSSSDSDPRSHEFEYGFDQDDREPPPVDTASWPPLIARAHRAVERARELIAVATQHRRRIVALQRIRSRIRAVAVAVH